MADPHGTRPGTPGGAAFEQEAQERSQGFLRDLVDFTRHNKKWWLTPIIVVLLLLGMLVLVGGTGAGPLIYTLF